MTQDIPQPRSWPYEQARLLLNHIEKKGKKPGDVVTFCTGYGPSGAPHIGTFGEVYRTLMVLMAFRDITQDAYQPRLIVFSDDMDALRKRPDDVPESMDAHLGRSLAQIPSPWNAEESFADHNVNKLEGFIDLLIPVVFPGISLRSSTCYNEGLFNPYLSRVFENHDAILKVMRANMGEERGQTYCAFMPINEHGDVIHEGVTISPDFQDSVVFTDSTNNEVLYTIHDGNTKLQWKVDWAMRWIALDVDYEMSGKDLIDSVRVSGKICRLLGGTPPLNLTYELFLDENGEKISKSRGNGVSIETWLRYGSRESLAHFMYQNPRSAKKLFLGVIPRSMDEYLSHRRDYKEQTDLQRRDNPVHHIHGHKVPPFNSEVTFQLLINVIGVTALKTAAGVMSYLSGVRSFEGLDSHTLGYLDHVIGKAINYTHDVVLASRTLRDPSEGERTAFFDLADRIEKLGEGREVDEYQFEVYEVGKAHGFEPLRSWFQAIYEVFFGSSDGPRFGAFIHSYGAQASADLLRSR